MASLTIGVQMDPPARLKPARDSTLFLGREAQRRGHRLVYFTPNDVSAEAEDIVARVRELTLHGPEHTPHFELGEASPMNLNQCDVILLRQEPPFDMAYITNTFILEKVIGQGPIVLNHPAAVRNNPEKWIPMHYPEFIPPTLVSADEEAIRAFHRKHEEVVIKPLYAYGGKGVFHIGKAGENLGALLETMLSASREPSLVQRFLPQVHEEEKRIFILDGAVIGAFRRVPAQGDIRANMRVGGSIQKTELSQRQRHIAEAVGAACALQGIMLVGLDVIGDYLIEVNITCPTGLVQLQELYNIRADRLFWDAAEEVVTQRRLESADN